MVDDFIRATVRLRQTNSAELIGRIKRIRNAKLQIMSDEAITNRAERLLDGFAHKPMLLKTNAIFRARKNIPNQSFVNASQLWYPPKGVAKLGRFNGHQQPVFYAASSMAAAMKEVSGEAGETITILVCGSIKPMADVVTTHIGLHLYDGKPQPAKLPFADLRADAVFQQILKDEGIDRKWRLVDDLLSELSTSSAETRPDLYRLTNAFAEVLRRVPDSSGITYPSVATNLKAFNTALSCEAADAHFFPAEVWEVRILGKASSGIGSVQIPPGLIQIKPLRRSKKIAADGTIEWMDEELSVVADYSTVLKRVAEAREFIGRT